MTDIAEIGFKVDTTGILSAQKALDSLGDTFNKTESKLDKPVKLNTGEYTRSANKATGRVRELGKAHRTVVEQVARPLKAGGMDRFTHSVKGATTSVKGLSGAFSSVAAAIPALSLGAAASSMIQFGRAFDASMRNVQSKLGITVAEMDKLRSLAKRMGSQTSFSASQAAEAMGYLAQAGLDADKIMGALPNTLQLASAASLDLAEAADISTNIMGGFKLTVAELPRINDVLVATANKTNTSVQEMAYAFKAAGPIAANFGMTIEETAAAVGILANNGYKGEQAGTALRNMITTLKAPAGAAKKELEKLGLTTKDFFETLKDGSTHFKGVPNMLQKLQEKGKGAADFIQIFGKETASAALSLKGMGDELKSTEKAITDSGAAAKATAIKSKGLDAEIKKMASAWEALNLELMDAGGYDAASSGIALVTKGLGWLRENAHYATDGLSSLMDIFGGAGGRLAVVAAGVFGVVKAFGALKGAVTALNAIIVANPIGAALALITTAGWLFYDNWEDIVGGAKLLWQDFVDFVDGLVPDSWEEWKQAGVDFSNGLTEGIIAGTKKIVAAGEQLGRAAMGGYDKATDTHSPSREMIARGGWLTEGLAIGMAKGSAGARAAAAAMGKDVLREFDRVVDGLQKQYIKLTQGEEAARRYELTTKKITGAAQEQIITMERTNKLLELQDQQRKTSNQLLDQAALQHAKLTAQLTGNEEAARRYELQNKKTVDGQRLLTAAMVEEIIQAERNNEALKKQVEQKQLKAKADEAAAQAIKEATEAEKESAKALMLARKGVHLTDVELRTLTLTYQRGYNPQLAKSQALNEEDTKRFAEKRRRIQEVQKELSELTDKQYLHNIRMTQGEAAAKAAELGLRGYSEEMAGYKVRMEESIALQASFSDAVTESLLNATSVKDVFKGLGDWLKNWLKERIAHFATNKIMTFVERAPVNQGLPAQGLSDNPLTMANAGGFQGAMMSGGLGMMAGQMMGQSGIGTGLGAAIGSFVPVIGNVLGGVLGGVIESAFGSKKKETGRGIEVGYRGGEVYGSSYTDYSKKKSFWRGTDRWTEYDDLSDEVDDKLSAFFGNLKQSVQQQASLLGFAGDDVLSDLVIEATRFEGEDAEEKLAEWLKDTTKKGYRQAFDKLDPWVQKAIGDSFDLFGGRLTGEIAKLSEQGNLGAWAASLMGDEETQLMTEGMSAEEVAKRFDYVSQVATRVVPSLNALGLAISESFGQSVYYATQLTDSFGSVEKAMNRLGFYAGNFIPAAERQARSVEQARKVLNDWNTTIGLAGNHIIDTREEFRAYIESLDMTTEAGRAAATAAMENMEALLLVEGANKRTVANLTAVREAAEQLNLTFNSTGPLSAAAATGLVELMGGLEAFTEATRNYYDLFYSAEEKKQLQLAAAAKEVEKFNAAMGLSGEGAIDTKAEFRSLVESLDLNTEAGRQAYASAMDVASSMALVADSGKSLDAIMQSLPDNLRGALNQMTDQTSAAAKQLQASATAAEGALDKVAGAIDDMVSSTRKALDDANKVRAAQPEGAATELFVKKPLSGKDRPDTSAANLMKVQQTEKRNLAERAEATRGLTIKEALNVRKGFNQVVSQNVKAMNDLSSFTKRLIAKTEESNRISRRKPA